MDEPVRMMLLDAVFTDAPISAPATPPSVLLYGLNMEGVSIAVHVNDFVLYFWSPALVCKLDGKVVPLDESSLDTISIIKCWPVVRKVVSSVIDLSHFPEPALFSMTFLAFAGSASRNSCSYGFIHMVRVQSLLLRSARTEGWLLGGTTLNGQLSESPFLLHPKDNHTAGYYQDPVAILDFASLYPSLFMAHNLCYTTLVHPEDARAMRVEMLTTSPTGAQFVVASVRGGVLHRICGALITARKQAS